MNKRQKFGQIYDQYIEKIYRFVFLKVGSQDTAEDLCSETFLRGWEAFKKMQNSKGKNQNENSKFKIENPQAFLYRIARNLVVDYYRQKGREPVVLAEYASAALIDPEQDLAEKAILNFDIDTILLALTKLKDDYQNVIIWRYLDELSFTEIAELLGRTEEATRVLLHRALKQLRTILK